MDNNYVWYAPVYKDPQLTMSISDRQITFSKAIRDKLANLKVTIGLDVEDNKLLIRFDEEEGRKLTSSGGIQFASAAKEFKHWLNAAGHYPKGYKPVRYKLEEINSALKIYKATKLEGIED